MPHSRIVVFSSINWTHFSNSILSDAKAIYLWDYQLSSLSWTPATFDWLFQTPYPNYSTLWQHWVSTVLSLILLCDALLLENQWEIDLVQVVKCIMAAESTSMEREDPGRNVIGVFSSLQQNYDTEQDIREVGSITVVWIQHTDVCIRCLYTACFFLL